MLSCEATSILEAKKIGFQYDQTMSFQISITNVPVNWFTFVQLKWGKRTETKLMRFIIHSINKISLKLAIYSLAVTFSGKIVIVVIVLV